MRRAQSENGRTLGGDSRRRICKGSFEASGEISSPEASTAGCAGAFRKSRRLGIPVTLYWGSASVLESAYPAIGFAPLAQPMEVFPSRSGRTLIHIKDSGYCSLIVGALERGGRTAVNIEQRSTNKLAAGSRESAAPTRDREWPLRKPVFVTLISVGYVCAALALYFMFSAVHPL